MPSDHRKSILGYGLFTEHGADKWTRHLSLETFVTFVSLVVNHSA